jgi:hypothetical protein
MQAAAVVTVVPQPTLPNAAQAEVVLPTVTPAKTLPPRPTATPAADLLPTPTPAPVDYTSEAGAFRLHLPRPWRSVDLGAADPITGTVERVVALAAVRPDAAEELVATMSLAVVPAHGLTLDQWRDATAAAMVLAGFTVRETEMGKAGGEARVPVARLTYQVPRHSNAVPELGVQLAWFAPDDQLALVTFTLDAAVYSDLLPEIDQMLDALDFAPTTLPQ